ncbi:MAG: hypothetical protein ACJ8LG_18140 [Massilia sp.]
MRALRNFEVEVIRLLGKSSLDKRQLDSLAAFTGSAEYEYTGSGYYLTLRMPTLPDLRETLSNAFVMGKADGIECGFVVFLEHGELTLECHTWGAIDVPSDFRERNVVLSMPEVNYINLTGD